MKKPAKTTKKKKTDQICVRLPVKTIDYLNSKQNDEDDSAPAVARRIIEQKRREEEEKAGDG